jgi:isopentenyl phosphate kinase
MLTFLKLGGSIITDKRGKEAANLPTIGRLTREISAARAAYAHGTLIIGHGSGSFGHVYAARYGVHRGLALDADWIGYALTARAALRLNRIVVDALLAASVPALSVQPSAALTSRGGELESWNVDTIAHALQRRLVPVIHGDVAFDHTQGCAIMSTEALFAYLAHHTPLQPARLILVGETAVYTADPALNSDARLVPLITEHNIAEVLDYTGNSRGIDVTGGMQSKLRLMWQLVATIPGLEVHIINAEPGMLTRTLRGEPTTGGTTMRKE